ncbi:asparagine synthase C-terminal domain-containing protein [Haloarchaeobius amylolyticus]|uniref:asparagine synthase C-terminal domain-containing protein n=1 Tax=Haloarchaeobius amylolyticus TaxID=1198296 RepID=UPI00226E2F87|nr:asparagine synthase-related protein [Haloarchaeobius amylolyticus]
MQGASAEVVRRAVDDDEPLPGTAGFAGELDGRLVRDVLGRYPLFADPATGDWAFDPTELSNPEAVAPGSYVTDDGQRRQWTLPSLEPEQDRRAAVQNVRAAIRESAATLPRDGKTAVAFSGGVDSALVAALVDGPCYVVGFPESHDLAQARRAAELMDVELRVVELTTDRLAAAVPAVAEATGRTNAMDVGIALPLYLVAEQVAADGYDRLAVGQGADELFGGYAKVAGAPDDPRVEATTVRAAARELMGTLPNQLERDVLGLRAAGVEPVAPLLHDAVVAAALRLPGELLVDGRGERKKALRLAARDWLPDAVAFREKKAVQYGSLVARELDRLARQAGFKRRLDDHVTRYVESRV